jgi:hypothetical protein
MGGYNSGRRGGHAAVEDGFSLTLRRLFDQGLLRPGYAVAGTIRWTLVATGEERATIGFDANLRAGDEGSIRLHYTINGAPQDYTVSLATSPCNYGGKRWWFICPASGRRCLKLHLPPGGTIFAARQAYRLAYRSQRQAPMDRSHSRQTSLYRRLGVEYDCFDEMIPERPKGMRRATYHRLAARLTGAIDRHEELFVIGALRLLERLKSPPPR